MQYKEEEKLSLRSKKERSLLAQCKLDILLLGIETGRYKGEKEEKHLCIFSNKREIETENHLACCPLYN